MSSKRAEVERDELFLGAVEAVSVLEEEYGCHVHYVIRRDPVSPRKGRLNVTILAVRAGVGDSHTTLARVQAEYPASNYGTLSGLCLRLVVELANKLGVIADQEQATQNDLFS